MALTLETIDSNASSQPSIAVDSNNMEHISYRRSSDGALMYAKYNGTSWDIEVANDDSINGGDSDIALDSNDRPHIISRRQSDGHLIYTRWNGSSWVKSVAISSSSNEPKIDMASNDRPGISYTSSGSVHFARWNGSNWTGTASGSIDTANTISDVAFNSSDNPSVVYYKSNAVHYASWNGSSWDTASIGVSGNSLNPSVDFDSSDVPFIAYQNSSNSAVEFARWNGSSWDTNETISDSSNPNQPSLFIDVNDKAHVIYGNGGTGKTGYSCYNGSSWDSQVIDSDDNTNNAEISAFSNSEPAIPYINLDEADRLKIAKGELPVPTPTPTPTPTETSSVTPTPTVVESPKFTYRFPNIKSISDTTASVNVSLDTDGTSWAVIVPKGSSRPTSSQIKAGLDGDGATLPAGSTDTASQTRGVVSILSFSGLTDCLKYIVYIVGEDDENVEVEHSAAELRLKTLKTKDLPEHNSTYPKIGRTTVRTVEVLISMDEDGKSYGVLLEKDAPAPTVDQIRQGRDSFGRRVSLFRRGRANLRSNIEANMRFFSINDAITKEYDIYIVSEKRGDKQCDDKTLQTPDSPVKLTVELERPKILKFRS